MTERFERVGRYHVLDAARVLLGEGRVRLAAFDSQLGRRVTIELFPVTVADGEDEVSARLRVLRVGQTLARLEHRHLQRVYDVGVADGRVFFALERPSERTLEAWVREDPRRLTSAIVQVGEGVAAAHRAGLVHGAFTLSSVTVDADGRCTVGGFAASSSASTPVGASSAADQWALACAFRELASTVAWAEPRWFSAIIERALSAEAGRRFSNLDELVAALRRGAGLRARRALVWTLGVGLVLMGACASWLSGRARSRCLAQVGSLDGAWDKGVKERLDSAFASVETPFTADVRASVVARLDEHARRWDGASTATCSTPDSEARRARLECLRWWRDELAAVTLVLSSADATVVENAASAVDALSNAEECEGRLTSRRFGLPGNRSPEFDAVRLELARAKALTETGRWKEASVAASAVVERCRGVNQALYAQALLARSMLESRLGNPRGAFSDAREAVLVAFASGDDLLSAQAGLRAATLAPGSAERSRSTEVTRALVRRVGSNAQLERAARRFEAQQLGREARFAEANELYRRVVEDDRRTFGPSHLTTLSSTFNAGITQFESGDLGGAFARFEEAHRQSLTVFGARHPRTARYRTSMGAVALELGRFDEARRAYAEALEVHRALGEDNMLVADDLAGLAEALKRLGRLDEALSTIEHARAITARQGTPVVAAHLSTTRGEIVLAAGQPAAAVDAFREAIAGYEVSEGGSTPKLAAPLMGLASALRALGRAREGLPFAERAIALDNQLRVSARAKLTLARSLDALNENPERVRRLVNEARVALRSAEGSPDDLRELDEVEKLVAPATH